MTLPDWYLECAEDYLSILRSSQQYSHKEILEATTRQRSAEYKLMRERMQKEHNTYQMERKAHITQYDQSVMYKGYYQPACVPRFATLPKKDFWENILKPED